MPYRLPGFLLKSTIAGLALAFVLVVLNPRWIFPDAETAAISATGRASYAGAVAAAAPAVVNIHSARVVRARPNPFLEEPRFKRFFKDVLPAPEERVITSLGSGVIMSAEGIVLTNNHVIRGADEIEVMLKDGRLAPARIAGTDPDTDLAVLKIDLPDLPSIAFDLDAGLRVGDVVLAIGNPFGVGQTVTMGIVSATGRRDLGLNTFEDFIQTDAAINPGNSGGALIDPQGHLVGINTAIFSRSGGSQGIGFAIPASLAHGVMREILAHGQVARGWLGIQVQPPRRSQPASADGAKASGVLVTGIVPGAPGDRAGLRPGDLITRIGAAAVDNPRGALNAIALVKPGDTVVLTIERAKRTYTLPVTVAQRPRPGG